MVVAASGIILKDKKILLIHRSGHNDLFPHTWACPGGRAEAGETPEQAAARGVKEEVNLAFTPSWLFKTGKYADRDLFRYLGKWSGEVRIQTESTEYGWFSYAEAIKLDLGFDYREVIELLHKEGLI
jgi:8-oxo-dGTP diphosphatase